MIQKTKSNYSFPDSKSFKIPNSIDKFYMVLKKMVRDLYDDLKNLVSDTHTQDTDQYLDYGGSNQVAVADIKSVIPVEGTFTPTLTFGGASTGITYSNQEGRYTKIGNIVYISLDFTLSSKGTATGLARISGLPFTVGTLNTGGGICGVVYYENYATTFVHKDRFEENATFVSLAKGNVTTVTQQADTDFNNNTRLYIGGFYFVD